MVLNFLFRMNPYLILGVGPDADDAAVRRAYLDALKQAPPEREPRRFQTVTAAYDKIKDEASRHRHTLFNQTPPGDTPLDAFVGCVRLGSKSQPIPFEEMKAFLQSCAKT